MLADGLTKLLPRQKHENFVKQLGLVDLSKLGLIQNSCSSYSGGVLNQANMFPGGLALAMDRLSVACGYSEVA